RVAHRDRNGRDRRRSARPSPDADRYGAGAPGARARVPNRHRRVRAPSATAFAWASRRPPPRRAGHTGRTGRRAASPRGPYRDLEVLDVIDRAREIPPEIPQQIAPGDLAVGDPIELLLERRGEIVFDVAGEKGLEERDDDPPFVLGNEALAVDAHITAVLEHG